MWLIAGLGNPDREHEGNRHNVGFMALDRITRDHDFGVWRKRFNAEISDGLLGRDKVLLIKPQTFMNRSGQAVAQAAKFYKIPAEKIVVLYDELDLPPGKVKVKRGGGAAGHNGIRSIDADLGDTDYWRVRIGIGHPGEKSMVTSHVLSNFDADELHVTDLTLAAISRNFEFLIAGRDADFMTRVSEDMKKV